MNIRIKPLVWREVYENAPGTARTAVTPFGTYAAYDDEWQMTKPMICTPALKGEAKSIEHAQAQCEIHYQRSIMDLLEISVDGDVFDQMREDIVKACRDIRGLGTIMERVPTGVYYSKEHSNFYNADQGMGQDFYDKWKPYSRMFPQTRTEILTVVSD